jgi:TetR/AcrR family transcriptional regulator, regulator of cefoperazone and chloramphenicol sensitivity
MAAALPDDLTARARIREAAFRRFAAHGVEGTSLRAIADDAGTSAALVVHHFGSKQGLVRAVDDAAVATFRAALDDVSTDQAPDAISADFGLVFERIIGGDPVMRAYLRRALLQDEPASTALLDEMLDVTRMGLETLARAGGVRPDSDPQWRPYQALFVALGSMLLEPVLQRELDGHAFDPEVVRSRSAANLDFFTHGMLSSRPDG